MRRAHVADRAFTRVHVVGHCVVQCKALAQFDVVAYPVVFVMVMSRSLTMSAHGAMGIATVETIGPASGSFFVFSVLLVLLRVPDDRERLRKQRSRLV